MVDENGESTGVQVTYKNLHTEFNKKYMKPIKVFTFRSRMIKKKCLDNAYDIPVMEIQYSVRDKLIILFLKIYSNFLFRQNVIKLDLIPR